MYGLLDELMNWLIDRVGFSLQNTKHHCAALQCWIVMFIMPINPLLSASLLTNDNCLYNTVLRFHCLLPWQYDNPVINFKPFYCFFCYYFTDPLFPRCNFPTICCVLSAGELCNLVLKSWEVLVKQFLISRGTAQFNPK